MKIPCFHVDAFTRAVFGGNPAAICPLESWLPDATLQNIAAENNLSETAFVIRRDDAYDLRWFTPTVEIDLCGHATLAAAFVLFTEHGIATNAIHFHSKSGVLSVLRDGERLVLDFPARPATLTKALDDLILSLGATPVAILKARDYLAVFENEAAIRALTPDFAMLARLDSFGVIVTAPGHDCDFVSRFFAPGAGVNEDPVTGSAHCTLIPYWAQRLGKTKLFARQVSQRGGELFCELAGDRVRIGGKAVLYLRGEIEIVDNKI